MMEHEEGPEDTSPKYFKMTPPVMDADASVGALLGDPDNIPCSMIAELGFCGFDPFWAVCPKSCGYPEGALRSLFKLSPLRFTFSCEVPTCLEGTLSCGSALFSYLNTNFTCQVVI